MIISCRKTLDFIFEILILFFFSDLKDQELIVKIQELRLR